LQGDPSTCGFIMSEPQYEAYARSKKVATPLSCGDADDVAVEQGLDMKEEVDELKQILDSVVTELCELRVQVHKLKMQIVVVAAVCVGVAIGFVMSKLW